MVFVLLLSEVLPKLHSKPCFFFLFFPVVTAAKATLGLQDVACVLVLSDMRHNCHCYRHGRSVTGLITIIANVVSMAAFIFFEVSEGVILLPLM